MNLNSFTDEFCRLQITVTGANGETKFTLSKMPGTIAWDTLEDIREALSDPILKRSNDARGVMEQILLALPKQFTRRLRDRMFQYVTFTNSIARTPLTLAGAEETAFDAIDAEPVAIYEVFVRSLAVNFTGSYRDLVARISIPPTST